MAEEKCNSTLWNETVEPLLAIYSASINGELASLLKAIDLEMEFLDSNSSSYPNKSNAEVLGEKRNDLCDIDINHTQNLPFACEKSESEEDDAHSGTCVCFGLWQRNVLLLPNPWTGDMACYAAPRSKCRKYSSILRHLSGWLECVPGSECIVDKVQEKQVVGANVDYDYAYGTCECTNAGPNEDECLTLLNRFSPQVTSQGIIRSAPPKIAFTNPLLVLFASRIGF